MSYFDPKLLNKYPSEAGVYLMKNQKKEVIYVGKAKNLKNRIKQYFLPGRDGREMVPFLIAEIVTIDFIVVLNEKEALLLESTLIKKHQPKFNALLKDDKTFISLHMNTQEKWPMLRIVRYKDKQKKTGFYFGPYTSAYAARQTFDLMHRIFPLRQCSNEEFKRRSRPCLLHGIKRCIAPCVEKCTTEEYRSLVDKAIDFLKGHDQKIIQELHEEIQKASDTLEFERAASLLTTLKQIQHVLQGGGIVARSSGKNCDALALYRHYREVVLVQLLFRDGKLIGSNPYTFAETIESDEELLTSFLFQYYLESPLKPDEIILPFHLSESDLIEELLSLRLLYPKKGDKKEILLMAQKNAQALFQQKKDENELTEKLLIDLQETLGLSRYPEKIECFDISNISGSDLVAAMVCFHQGKYDKKHSRVFTIRDLQVSDDYAALKQVISRRLTRSKENNELPDLIIVDGGKGQLNRAVEALQQLDIATVDIISIAKDKGKHQKNLTQEKIFVPHHLSPITLPVDSPLLFLLQRIRDETHRRAIGFHRKKREKRLITSLIDTIPGIGPVKKKRLLLHFGSFQQILLASEGALKQIKGITDKDIENIRRFNSKA